MTVRRYDDPEAFLALVEASLVPGSARLAMFCAWLTSIGRSRERDRCYLAVWERDGRAAEAFQRADGPIVLGDDVDAAHAFADDIVKDYPQLRGVVGALGACEAFASRWQTLTGRVHRVRFHMRNHVLDTSAIPASARGCSRVASEDDLPWLLEAQTAFAREAHLPDSREVMHAAVRERQAHGHYRIWDDGGAVAFAGWSEAGPDAARIAPVYTLPDRRRRGYATALVFELASELRAQSRTSVFLVTDLANPGANALYAKVGFRPLDDFYHFDLVDP